MKIRIKLFSLLVVLVACIVSSVTFYLHVEDRIILLILANEKHEKTDLFDKVTDLSGASLQSYASDYSFWDEMVTFVSQGDPGWAKENLDTSLSIFRAHACWVYRPDHSLVYSVNDLRDTKLDALPIPGEAFSRLFANGQRFCHFFIDTAEGLMEIRGATVHPVSDVERKTTPRGFFFAGRVYDQAYFNDLARNTSTGITIFKASEKAGIQENDVPEQGIVYFPKWLRGWDGRPLAFLRVKAESRTIREFNRFSRDIVWVLVAFSAMIVLVLLFFVSRWVYFPLKLISRTLTANDVSHIRRLFKKGDEFGDISGLIRTFFEQKETLKESEQYVTAILNSLQSGILVIDAASHVIAYANPAAARMIGVPVEKIVGANCQQYVCPAEIGKCPITDLGKTVDNAERVLLSATGWRIPIIKTVNFITLKGRRYLIESFVDITDRKKAEEEIKNAYQMTRSILEKSPFGVYLVNDAGFIDYVNPAMLKISGDSYVQFKNVNVFDLPAYRQSGIAQKIDTALKGESFHAGNVEISSVSKKASVLNIFGMPFYERGETKALIFAEDVTELKKLEEIKNSLTHMIIHDLNNPLTALLGSLQLLQLDLGPSLTEDQKASLEIMVLASQDLRRITRDLLDINKMESGTIKLNPQPISLSGLAREVVEQMKVAANNSGKSLIMEEPPELPAVNADQEIIHRVIANLINNSLKFTPQKGSVTVKLFLAEQGKNVRVQIKDTGEGIQPDYLDKIFDKFFQVQTEKAQFGHGLGLTFCKMMVEAHGGRIWAESDGPGTGSTFTFSLPV